MQSLTIFLGFILLASNINALPTSLDSEGNSSNEENGLIYVFNIYAVRNVKSEVVGKMLSEGGLEKMPSSFESIGSIILADNDGEDPFTLADISETLEDMGVSVKKLNEEEEPKVIEINMDMSMEDLEDYISFEELAKLLQAEGIIIEMNEESSYRFIQIAFDSSKKDPQDQPFTLRELAEFFENEGYDVDVISSGDVVTAIRIHIDNKLEDGTPKRPDQSINPTTNKKDEKKIEKGDRKDDHFSTLDYITKSDSLNKIRRRRSACPECKTGNILKDFIEKYK